MACAEGGVVARADAPQTRGSLAILLCALTLSALTAFADPAEEYPDIAVTVRKDGATFEIQLDFAVAATARETWSVLTDYDHMAEILSSVDASAVVSRTGNSIDVAQTSHGEIGPIRVNVDSLRHIELFPFREIRSRFLKGDLKASDFTTYIADEGASSRVSGHGVMILGAVSALAVSARSVEDVTRRQYGELRAEILRRKANVPPPPCLLTKTCRQRDG